MRTINLKTDRIGLGKLLEFVESDENLVRVDSVKDGEPVFSIGEITSERIDPKDKGGRFLTFVYNVRIEATSNVGEHRDRINDLYDVLKKVMQY
ncbi:MAG: hypothetical protein WC796_04980 [Candidatus Pacearchaeota archaeon]|jgi:hypothetical protein